MARDGRQSLLRSVAGSAGPVPCVTADSPASLASAGLRVGNNLAEFRQKDANARTHT
jgi:hypothetical protein